MYVVRMYVPVALQLHSYCIALALGLELEFVCLDSTYVVFQSLCLYDLGQSLLHYIVILLFLSNLYYIHFSTIL